MCYKLSWANLLYFAALCLIFDSENWFLKRHMNFTFCASLISGDVILLNVLIFRILLRHLKEYFEESRVCRLAVWVSIWYIFGHIKNQHCQNSLIGNMHDGRLKAEACGVLNIWGMFPLVDTCCKYSPKALDYFKSKAFGLKIENSLKWKHFLIKFWSCRIIRLCLWLEASEAFYRPGCVKRAAEKAWVIAWLLLRCNKCQWIH